MVSTIPNLLRSRSKKFEYVIIVLFDDNFKLKSILELSWDQFLQSKRWHKTMRGWNLSITREHVNNATKIY